MRAIILLVALAWLTPRMVANRCVSEASFAVRECSCTVHNRLQAGWSERRVLDAYYAMDGHATSEQVATASAILDGSATCDPALYFMYSRQDTIYLGIGHYTPALTVCNGDKCVQFFERWFRRN